MIDYGRYYNAISDAFYAETRRVVCLRNGEMHRKVRDSAMRRMWRLERYMTRAEGVKP